MKPITIIIERDEPGNPRDHRTPIREQYRQLERAARLKPIDIAKKLAGDSEKAANYQGWYSNIASGRRDVPKDKIPVLAKMFGVSEAKIRSLNGGLKPNLNKSLCIEIPSDMDVTDFLKGISRRKITAGKLVIELWAEFNRRQITEAIL